jgi:predicted PurR-regulated permease PerM
MGFTIVPSAKKTAMLVPKHEGEIRTILLPPWARWGLLFPLIVLNGWLLLSVAGYLQPLINIFAVATLLSFVLDYPVLLLQRLHIKRGFAIGIVSLLVLAILVTLGGTLAPVLLQQLTELTNRLPSWIDSGRRQFTALQEWDIFQRLPENITVLLNNLTNQLTAQLSGRLQALTGQVVSLAFSTVDSVVNIVVTIVLSVYLLLYGENLWNGLFRWFPTELGTRVRRSLYQNFHNWFVGQVVVATVMGSTLTLTFLFLKVPLGLLFGLTVGLLTLIPFGGILSISIVSFLVSLQNFGLGLEVLGASLLINQINDNLVIPRVLGGFTGLNPVWVLISLLIGVKLGGVLGLLLAVPLASSIKNMADQLRPPTLPPDTESSEAKSVTPLADSPKPMEVSS